MYLLSVVCFSFLFVSVQSGGGSDLYAQSESDPPWSYQEGNNGPSEWFKDYPICGGDLQSPINIDIDKVKCDPTLEPLDTCAYQDCEGVHQELQNVEGHKAEVLYSGKPLIIRGGSLSGEYVLDEFHFHWGSDDSKGSEHTINGSPYPMEMHIVHHSNRFDNKTAAQTEPDGLAVNAFFFKVGRHNPAYTELLSHFPKIKYADETTDLEPAIKLSDLLPKCYGVYYRYEGSLTTPPCFETVTWTIYTTPIEISERQLNVFRSLKRNKRGEPDQPLVDDFRPIQPLNNRIVYTNHPRGLMSSHQIGTYGSNSHNGHGTCNGGSNKPGTCNGGSHKPCTCNGGSHNPGTCNGGSHNPGTCNGGSYNPGTCNGGSYNPCTCNGGSNNCGKCNGGKHKCNNCCKEDGDDDNDGNCKCKNRCEKDGDDW